MVTCACVFAMTAQEQTMYPDSIGWINVKVRYGAKGDGVTDDTEALRRAVGELNHQYLDRVSLYLPDGVYLVTDTLAYAQGYWDCCVSIQGQSRANTIIRLKDKAPGYGDSTLPKPVLYTRSGNQSFHQNIRDITIDVGEGNPGAVAIDYIANNTGVIRNVQIQAPKGSGHTAISMLRAWPGPALITNVTIQGFATGIDIGYSEYSMTFEHVTMNNQRSTSFLNRGNTVIGRALRSSGSEHGYIQLGGSGVLIESDCQVERSAGPILLRDHVSTSGGDVYRGPDTTIAGPINELLVGTTYRLWPGTGLTLRLPIQETPRSYVNNDTSAWANIAAYGAQASDPFFVKRIDNQAIRAAMQSGKPVVWLPITKSNGSCFGIDTPIVVPSSVRLITGFDQSKFCFFDSGVLVVEGDGPEPLFIERMNGVKILHRGKRPVVLRDIGIGYENVPGAGNVFLENVVGAFTPTHATNMWARQFNPEIQPSNEYQHKNHGGTAWILGMKTEGFAHLTETTNGGSTEVLGGLVYPAQSYKDGDRPVAWIVDNARLSVIHTMISYVSQGWYPVAVKEVRGVEVRELLTKDLSWPFMTLFTTGTSTSSVEATSLNDVPSIVRRDGMVYVNDVPAANVLVYSLLGQLTLLSAPGPVIVVVQDGSRTRSALVW